MLTTDVSLFSLEVLKAVQLSRITLARESWNFCWAAKAFVGRVSNVPMGLKGF